MIFLSIEQVIAIHDDLITQYGGLHGIRDIQLLMSALEMPKASMFGEDLHASIYDKASAYLFHIICNHAFIDGNKRTGTAVALIFLMQNGVRVKHSVKAIEEMVCKVAKGQFTKKEISEFFEGE